MLSLSDFRLARSRSLSVGAGLPTPRRIRPERAATAPPIPVWRYRLVPGAAELSGRLRRRRAGNTAVRVRVTHLRAVSSRARGRRLGQRFRSGGAGAQLWGTVRREPIETADRRLAVACVRSGISGWVIGLLIRARAVAERRAANEGKQGDC